MPIIVRPLDEAWFHLNAFLVMGGFSIDNLPENYHQAFRDA